MVKVQTAYPLGFHLPHASGKRSLIHQSVQRSLSLGVTHECLPTRGYFKNSRRPGCRLYILPSILCRDHSPVPRSSVKLSRGDSHSAPTYGT